MKSLQLDFASRARHERSMAGMAAAFVLFLLVAGLVIKHRDILDRITRLEASADATNGPHKTGRRALPDPAEQGETRAAQEAQHALNMPWNDLLHALEQAQSRNGKISLIAVQPNPVKGEVTVNGEAEDFNVLMDYVKSLREQKVFSDVVLINQRWVEEDGEQRLGFALSAGWKI
jgi:hypothetical protein